MAKFYFLQQLPESREAHVYIYGDIVTSQWYDEEVSATSFSNELKALDVDTIHCHIDSYGGVVSEGFAIYNTLKSHPAKVITYADGFVASAAIYPFLAGDERIASPLSAFFLHRVLCSATGNAEELRAVADEAEQLNAIGLNAFEALGIDKDLILKLEEAETWLAPEKALELGIATAISDISSKENAQQSVRSTVVKALLNPVAEQSLPEEPTPIPAPEPEKKSFREILKNSFI